MRRSAIVAGCLLALAMGRSGQAENWFSDSWHDFWAATHRNNAWPEAFIPADRYAARAPFATCVANGWRAQNTLVDYHFDDETGRLNEAGGAARPIDPRVHASRLPHGLRAAWCDA